MAISLMQKLRLWLRGTSRRREERDRDFLSKNSWAVTPQAAPAKAASQAATAEAAVDRDGLQAAYLDQSGRIAYYLDRESGEVVEVRDGPALTASRYRRVPTQSDDEDRRAFLETVDPAVRRRLANAPSFRAALAEDRALERAWYNFKNDRATAAIEAWLSEG